MLNDMENNLVWFRMTGASEIVFFGFTQMDGKLKRNETRFVPTCYFKNNAEWGISSQILQTKVDLRETAASMRFDFLWLGHVYAVPSWIALCRRIMKCCHSTLNALILSVIRQPICIYQCLLRVKILNNSRLVFVVSPKWAGLIYGPMHRMFCGYLLWLFDWFRVTLGEPICFQLSLTTSKHCIVTENCNWPGSGQWLVR